MRNAHALFLATLVLAAPAIGQEVRVVTTRTTVVTGETPAHGSRLLDLSRQVSNASDAMRDQLERGEPQSGKLGKRLLSNLLNGGEREREGRDPIYREFDIASRELLTSAQDLDRANRHALERAAERHHELDRDGEGRHEVDREDRHEVDREERQHDLAREDHHEARVDGNRIDAERRFIRQFRNVERLASEVDRTLTAPTARGIFNEQITPGLRGIRAELPTLAAFREHHEEERVIRRSSRED